MRRSSAVVAYVAVAIALLCPSVASAGAADAEAQAIASLNEIRAANGLKALRTSRRLGALLGRLRALHAAQQLLRAPGSDSRGDQFRRPARRSRGIGLGAAPRRTVRQRTNSPSHRVVLMSTAFRQVGMGMDAGAWPDTPRPCGWPTSDIAEGAAAGGPGRELAAQRRQSALLALVEGVEEARNPVGVSRERRSTEVVPRRREVDEQNAAVGGRAAADHEVARSEGGRDLGGVGLRPARRRRRVLSSSVPPAVVSTTSTEKPAADTPSRSSSAARRRRTAASASTSD